MNLSLNKNKVKSILESLLLVSKKPLIIKELENILEIPQAELSEAMEELVLDYSQKGIKIINIAYGYQLATDPENILFVEKVANAKIETTLSPSAMETLAIIAYKQPITQPDIEHIRGVISDSVVQTLIARGVVIEKGRSESVGRPYIYGTTDEFLRIFGLKDLNDLPPLPEDLAEQAEAFKSEELLQSKIEPAIFEQNKSDDLPQAQTN